MKRTADSTAVLNLTDAAARLGISPHTLRKYVKAERVHATITPRGYRFTLADLAKYSKMYPNG